MDANKFYLVTQTHDGQVLYILSDWNAIQDRPGSNSSICQLTIYTNNMLFQSEQLTSDNINTLVSAPNFYLRIRNYFRKNVQDVRFKFQLSNEEDEAHLEVSLPLDHTLTNYVNILEAKLHRVFKHNSHLEFLNRLGNYAQFKETQQDNAAERLENLESIQGIVEETKAAVERLRQEAGLQLATRFMGVINNHKEKIASMSESSAPPDPAIQPLQESEYPPKKKPKVNTRKNL